MEILNKLLSTGDFPYFFEKTISELNYYPYIWSNTNGDGFGQNVSFVLGYKTFFNILSKPLVEFLGVNWYFVEKLIFIIPFFVIAFFSSYLLSSKFFKPKLLRYLSGLIFATNTYALMLVAGGQMGVAIAYALTPLVIFYLIKSIVDKKVLEFNSNFFLAIIFLSLQILIDSRLALISLIITFVFYLLKLVVKDISLYKFINLFVVTIISILINSFWIIPFILSKDLNLSLAYTSSDISTFFSFAKLEDAISLFHPNYPENIFGKVGFLKYEFLLLPIIAFSSLLFVNKKSKRDSGNIIILTVIGLIGIFLAKGANLPFSGLYNFLLDNIPFATIYRDPLKFYLIIAITYSILIPWSISLFGEFIDKRFKLNIMKLIFIIFVFFWLISIRHLFIFGPPGVFKPIQIDDEYFKFAKEFENTEDFSRTFSIPAKQRFTYSSQLSPVISANDYYKEYDNEDLIRIIKSENFIKDLENSSVKYVILPYDQQSEIFLKDRKFSQELYDEYYNTLSDVDLLVENDNFSNLKVFEIKNPKNLIWSENEDLNIDYKYKNPVSYDLYIKNGNKGDLIIFNQSYSPSWILKSGNKEIRAERFGKFNRFTLTSDNNAYKIYYKSQRFVNIGLLISFTSLGIVILLILRNLAKRRKK